MGQRNSKRYHYLSKGYDHIEKKGFEDDYGDLFVNDLKEPPFVEPSVKVYLISLFFSFKNQKKQNKLTFNYFIILKIIKILTDHILIF